MVEHRHQSWGAGVFQVQQLPHREHQLAAVWNQRPAARAGYPAARWNQLLHLQDDELYHRRLSARVESVPVVAGLRDVHVLLPGTHSRPHRQGVCLPSPARTGHRSHPGALEGGRQPLLPRVVQEARDRRPDVPDRGPRFQRAGGVLRHNPLVRPDCLQPADLLRLFRILRHGRGCCKWWDTTSRRTSGCPMPHATSPTSGGDGT